MHGISKAVLHNQEWSHITKHNILCLHSISVYHSLSIVLTAIPLFDPNIRFLISFGDPTLLALHLTTCSNRLTFVPCRLMI